MSHPPSSADAQSACRAANSHNASERANPWHAIALTPSRRDSASRTTASYTFARLVSFLLNQIIREFVGVVAGPRREVLGQKVATPFDRPAKGVRGAAVFDPLH